jgi:hypothetical protein
MSNLLGQICIQTRHEDTPRRFAPSEAISTAAYVVQLEIRYKPTINVDCNYRRIAPA